MASRPHKKKLTTRTGQSCETEAGWAPSAPGGPACAERKEHGVDEIKSKRKETRTIVARGEENGGSDLEDSLGRSGLEDSLGRSGRGRSSSECFRKKTTPDYEESVSANKTVESPPPLVAFAKRQSAQEERIASIRAMLETAEADKKRIADERLLFICKLALGLGPRVVCMGVSLSGGGMGTRIQVRQILARLPTQPLASYVLIDNPCSDGYAPFDFESSPDSKAEATTSVGAPTGKRNAVAEALWAKWSGLGGGRAPLWIGFFFWHNNFAEAEWRWCNEAPEEETKCRTFTAYSAPLQREIESAYQRAVMACAHTWHTPVLLAGDDIRVRVYSRPEMFDKSRMPSTEPISTAPSAPHFMLAAAMQTRVGEKGRPLLDANGFLRQRLVVRFPLSRPF